MGVMERSSARCAAVRICTRQVLSAWIVPAPRAILVASLRSGCMQLLCHSGGEVSRGYSCWQVVVGCGLLPMRRYGDLRVTEEFVVFENKREATWCEDYTSVIWKTPHASFSRGGPRYTFCYFICTGHVKCLSKVLQRKPRRNEALTFMQQKTL